MPTGIFKRKPTSEETKLKLSIANTGKKLSEETKNKIRLSHLGKKYKPMSEQGKENIRQAHLGYRIKEETKKKLSEALMGHKMPDHVKKMLIERNTGSNNYNWKGGVTPRNKAIRKSSEYREWRESVFERDNYTCQECGIRGGNGKKVTLQPHHIKPFCEHEELWFEVDNGTTLCVGCHRKTDSWGLNIRKELIWKTEKN